MTFEAPQSGPEQEIFGDWAQLAAAAGRAVSLVPGLSRASAFVDLLVALIDVQHSQTGLLKSIKADTAAERRAPFQEAVNNLQDARRVGPSHRFWGRYIDRAEDRLSQAFARASDPRDKAHIEYNRALVYLALGCEDDCRYYLGQSAQWANQEVDLCVRKAKVKIHDARLAAERTERHRLSPRTANVLNFTAAIATLNLSVLLYGALNGIKEATVDSVRLSYCDELKDFIGFFNLIEQTASSLSGDRRPRYLALHHNAGDDDYTLFFRGVLA
jgi:hypothetical protein